MTPRRRPPRASVATEADISASLNVEDFGGSPLASSSGWTVPEVTLRDGEIAWESRSPGVHSQHGERGLLGRFARLREAPAESVASFAARYGVLFYRPDDRGHGGYCGACSVARGGDLRLGPGRFNWLPEHGTEPVDAWRRLAADVYGCLAVAARFRNDEDVQGSDWALFGNLVIEPRPGPPGFTDAVGVSMPDSAASLILPPTRRATHSRRGWLTPPLVGAYLVNLMLEHAHPNLHWAPSTAELRIEPGGLLGELGLQLARLIASAAAFAVCAGCSDIYAPPRRPRAGEKSWCPSCRSSGAPQRAASMAYRRRR